MTIKEKQKQFQKQIKNGGLTIEIISLVVYAINKRAKNCRDKKNSYYYFATSWYCNNRSRIHEFVQNYKEREQELYEMKTNILCKLFEPKEIHIIYGRPYYYYEVGEYTFHNPADGTINYDCPTKVLDDFCTHGCETNQLLTSQFCTKVYNIIMKDDFHASEKKAA